MKKLIVLALCVLFVSSCGTLRDLGIGRGPDVAPPAGMTRPVPRPGSGGVAPAAGATTAEAFDTTTAQERAAAAAPPKPAGEVKLGRTVAALGNPADPGFWLETPLAEKTGPGRVSAVANGKTVQLELRPIEGPDSAGSRISLAALRLLDVGLAGLHELDVFAK